MIVSRGLGQNKHFPIVTGGYGLALLSEDEVTELYGLDDDFSERAKRQKIKDQNNILVLMISSAAAAGALHGQPYNVS